MTRRAVDIEKLRVALRRMSRGNLLVRALGLHGSREAAAGGRIRGMRA